jgi:hypothetical protein
MALQESPWPNQPKKHVCGKIGGTEGTGSETSRQEGQAERFHTRKENYPPSDENES